MHLTYPRSECKNGGVEPDGSAGAPVEIEITPEMIEMEIENWIEESRDSLEAGGSGDVTLLRLRLMKILLFSPCPFNGLKPRRHF